MSAPLRVGLVGAGWVTQHHLRAWRGLADRARIVAIADPSAENAARRAAEFDIETVHAGAAEMFATGDLDAVDIAAPRAVHAELVRLAANHGLAVLCQKPLAPTLTEAEALVADMADRTRLMVHENWRFRAYYRDAASWLRQGRIGTVKAAELRLVTSGTLLDENGRRPALERQPFMRTERRLLVAEVLIHHLDTLRMLLGPLQVTAAALSRTSPDVLGEDGAVIQLRSQAGAGIAVFASFAAHGAPPAQTDRLDILGDAGAIQLDGSTLSLHGSAPAQQHYDLTETYQNSYDATIAHFVDALAAGTPFETSPIDNLETLRLVEHCYRLSGWMQQ
ncbi:MAG TPA: Gfo/Idh/MocA family oxidoreductase [Aliidongia sp.]|uniref:Gfo/Idh/MocA family protein n=1 Tax=Aliidongia sp. TaxID=1914230 RepID=UPI002DDD62A8|nr:Gfo/Idh/MocA family oxidoreductase [Aliidongia sp.]HEV2678617.1 Gfo/Idh/MocA family oxidoreductase [Aliidongia sp.]